MNTKLYVERLLGSPLLLLSLGLALTTLVYAPGLSGGWLFDDFPNIVDNRAIHIERWDIPALVNAALSSPSSEFKRPLASLSFAINYLVSGNSPFAMKLTNLVIHLLNGVLAFFFIRELLGALEPDKRKRAARIAAAIAVGWMILPINLTSVLYVVQRMESMANLAVLLGLWGYVAGRRRMIYEGRGALLAMGSVLTATAIGLLAKETAVMIPLYAALIELFVFRAARCGIGTGRDWRVLMFIGLTLFMPMVLGAAWLLPRLLDPATWATRDFTLQTRLLSESRVVLSYIAWTLFPTPRALSFYHDSFEISRGLFSPGSTAWSIAVLSILAIFCVWSHRRLPMVALGISLFLGSHLLTGTCLPLELVYEHRNYFASLGLMLALVSTVVSIPHSLQHSRLVATSALLLLGGFWALQTSATARSWGDPVSLARELAWRDPNSPRAQYELGRTYIIASGYDPASPFTKLAYAPLEKAAAFPSSSILPEQALIFMNAKMHLQINNEWWESMIRKLQERPATIQDESSLDALSSCLRDGSCSFSPEPLYDAYAAALSHDRRSPRLLAMYASFAWHTLKDRALAIEVQREAVAAAPGEAAYRIGLARYDIELKDVKELTKQIEVLEAMNIGGRLESDLASLRSARQRIEESGCVSADGSCAH